MKYRGIACTTEVDQEGYIITDLQGLVDKDIDVLMDFNPDIKVGKARTWIENNVLMVETELDIDPSDLYAVPGFVVLEQDENVVTKARIFEIGLTDKPAETNVTKLRMVE